MEIRWTEWSEDHIARHDVTPAEVEEVVYDDETSRWRWTEVRDKPIRITLEVVGLTAERRGLLVVLSPDPDPAGTAFVVTARPLTDKERVALDAWRTR